MVKTKKLLKIAALVLSVVAASIIILSVWISRDNYVPQKLGNSVSAGINNRADKDGYSVAETQRYLFYIDKTTGEYPLVRIDKKTGEKKLLITEAADDTSGCLFIYKNSIIYTKAKRLRYSWGEYDIYSCDFNGKNEKLIKKKCGMPHMVIDDYLYYANGNGSVSRVSLISGSTRYVSSQPCYRFVGINGRSNECYFDTDLFYIVEVELNNRGINTFLIRQSKKMHADEWSGEAKNSYGILGVYNGVIWFFGDYGKSICKAEKKNGKWLTKVVVNMSEGIHFNDNAILEKDKIYYVSSDESKIIMYDINTGNKKEIYGESGAHIKVDAAIGDNILIEKWMTDKSRDDAMHEGDIDYCYINKSGKLLYNLG